MPVGRSPIPVSLPPDGYCTAEVAKRPERYPSARLHCMPAGHHHPRRVLYRGGREATGAVPVCEAALHACWAQPDPCKLTTTLDGY